MNSFGNWPVANPPDKPLCGVSVLVTRPAGRSVDLCRKIAAAGGRPIPFPTVDILPVENPEVARAGLSGCAAADVVIFVSRNAVTFARDLYPDLRRLVSGAGVFATGEGTAAELSRLGVAAKIGTSDGFGSEALLRLPELAEKQIRARAVVIVRGVDGREYLRGELERRGAGVRYVEVYRRAIPETSAGTAKKIWHADRPDVIVITSVQGLDHLLQMTPDMFHRTLFETRLAVISPRVRDHAIRVGFRAPVMVADSAVDDAVVDAVRKAARIGR